MQPFKRSKEVAASIVAAWINPPSGAFAALDIPAGRRSLLESAFAERLRRERMIVSRLRDALSRAAYALEGGDVKAEAKESITRECAAAIEASRLNVEEEGGDLTERLICNRSGTLNNGHWYHFDFQDSYSGRAFAMTFDFKAEFIYEAHLEGATAAQVASMIDFARAELRRMKESSNGKES